MKNEITYRGTIIFDPKDRTAKHKAQASWKKIAMIEFGGDMCDYYAWFIKKRYGVTLNSPLRGPHISFINDHVNDLNGGFYDKKNSGKLIGIETDSQRLVSDCEKKCDKMFKNGDLREGMTLQECITRLCY